MTDFKFGTKYPIGTVPEEFKVSTCAGLADKRVMLFIPADKYNRAMWTFGRWDLDKYSKRPRPYWSLECYTRIVDSRERQPTHWMPEPDEKDCE